MKEATGELNMTVITVIAIAAVGALFYAFIWPMIQRTITQQTCNAFGSNANGQKYYAVKVTAEQLKTIANDQSSVVSSSSEKTSNWACCAGANAASATVSAANCLAAN